MNEKQPNHNSNIQSIVIVGGGSAGWMTAAALSSTLSDKCQITLIESEDIGTVGVGEATIPPIKLFNQKLGINEKEFINNTQGSFKLGIQFIDWAKKGHSYFHPFGKYGRDFDFVKLHQYWLRENINGNAPSFDEFSMAWCLAKSNKFSIPSRDPKLVQSTYDYAYHFDASSYANYLQKLSKGRGTTRVEGKVKEVILRETDGFIESVKLASGQLISADLFIDCSGFSALLIEGALETGFTDWSHWLKCNSAVTVASENAGPLLPYTKSIAHDAGWQWKIPLQHRTGNGYVYCDKYINNEQAIDTLLANIEGKVLHEPRKLTFTTGHRNKFWNKNCVAIGLSAGFMEPLESTSLHLIQSAITRLLALFPDKSFNTLAIQEYNRITQIEYEDIRDFLILHYCVTERRDTDFWRDCSSMTIPDNLQYKIDHFRTSGRVVAKGTELFQNPSWLAVYIGQMIKPEGYDPLVDERTSVNANKILTNLRRTMLDTAETFPTHQQFIDMVNNPSRKI